MVIFDGPGIHLRHVVFIDLSIKERGQRWTITSLRVLHSEIMLNPLTTHAVWRHVPM